MLPLDFSQMKYIFLKIKNVFRNVKTVILFGGRVEITGNLFIFFSFYNQNYKKKKKKKNRERPNYYEGMSDHQWWAYREKDEVI